MPTSFRGKDGLLARVNFPLYSVQMLTSRHVLVGGGGGSSKTGVANGFEVFEISHDGNHFIAEEVLRHETGPNVVMNCAIHNTENRTYLASGQESHCQLYSVEMAVVESSPFKESNDILTVKNRKKREEFKESFPPKHNSSQKILTFKMKPLDSIQTDFSKNEPLQKVVRISSKGQFMATAGTDGHIRLWKFPQLKKLIDIKGHTKEVDDLDFNRKETQLVSLSKDGKAIIWSVSNGKKIRELSWDVPQDLKYIFKRCRFGAVEEDKEKNRLFVLTNPVGQPAGKGSAYLQMWEPETGNLKKSAAFEENVASLAVRNDGRFVAVGTMFTGSVDIFVAFSLQRVLHVNGAHNMFITGLEFLPVTGDLISITSTAEAAVISVSVDNRVCIHTLYHRRSIPIWLAIILIVVTLFFTFVLCSIVGL